jgi:hypothetical protein
VEERQFKLRELEIQLREAEAVDRKAREQDEERRLKEEMAVRMTEIKRKQRLDDERREKEMSLGEERANFLKR